MRTQTLIPAGMPRLARGAHRSARRGACFMEFASYLAGERWSDHPQCTDPALAALARGVNDCVGDARRDELIPLIPRVIGLRGDEVVGRIVALRAALAALPVCSMDRQRSLAVGILNLRRELAHRTPQHLALLVEQTAQQVPDAMAWATAYVATQRTTSHPLHASATHATTELACVGIAEACIDDPDSLLIATLEAAVGDVEAQLEMRNVSGRSLIHA